MHIMYNYVSPPLRGRYIVFMLSVIVVVVVHHKSLCAQLLLHYSSEFKTFLHACLLPYGASHFFLAGRSRYFYIAPFYLENVPKSTFPYISLKLTQILVWNLKYGYIIIRSVHIPSFTTVTFIFTSCFPF